MSLAIFYALQGDNFWLITWLRVTILVSVLAMTCLGVQIAKNMIELSVQIRREGEEKQRKLR